MRRIYLRIIIFGLATLILMLASWLVFEFYISHHFYTVIPQQVYRSRQLSGPEFDAYIKKYQIKSIVNLRGPQPPKEWYQQEIAITDATDIQHYDVLLPAHGLPTPQELKQLVTVLNEAPKPMLIHCRQGFDRSGFAAAISLILAGNNPLSQDARQFSYEYFVFTKDSIGKVVMPYYVKWLQQNQLKNNRKNFLRWVEQVAMNGTF